MQYTRTSLPLPQWKRNALGKLGLNSAHVINISDSLYRQITLSRCEELIKISCVLLCTTAGVWRTGVCAAAAVDLESRSDRCAVFRKQALIRWTQWLMTSVHNHRHLADRPATHTPAHRSGALDPGLRLVITHTTLWQSTMHHMSTLGNNLPILSDKCST